MRLPVATLAIGLAATGCACGSAAPPDGGPADAALTLPPFDAGVPCGGDNCLHCLPSCVPADVCLASGAWQCACVCTGPDGGFTPDGGLNAEAFCHAVVTQECDWMIGCHSDVLVAGFNVTEGRSLDDQVDPSQRAACIAKLDGDPGCALLMASLDAGRARWNVPLFVQCLESFYPAYPVPNCARDLNFLLANCQHDPWITPATGLNQECSLDAECDGGWCTASPAACGLCRGYLTPATSPCDRDAQCNPALGYCPGADGTNDGGACRAYVPAGGTCNLFDIQFEECGPTRVCTQTVNGDVCAPFVPPGAKCTPGHFECFRSEHTAAPETTCVETDGGFATCQALQSTSGGPCNDGDLFGTLTFGQICLETEFCNGLCVPRLPVNAPCTGAGECTAGTRCGLNGVCTPFGGPGSTCAASFECLNFLTCSNAGCIPEFASPGAPCSAAVPCASGYCSPTAGVCLPSQPDGTPCSTRYGDLSQCTGYLCSVYDGGVGVCETACWR